MPDEMTGPCPACGREIPLAMNGAVKKHAPAWDLPLCAGSGQMPKEAGR
jgi:hypothetical protein